MEIWPRDTPEMIRERLRQAARELRSASPTGGGLRPGAAAGARRRAGSGRELGGGAPRDARVPADGRPGTRHRKTGVGGAPGPEAAEGVAGDGCFASRGGPLALRGGCPPRGEGLSPFREGLSPRGARLSPFGEGLPPCGANSRLPGRASRLSGRTSRLSGRAPRLPRRTSRLPGRGSRPREASLSPAARHRRLTRAIRTKLPEAFCRPRGKAG